MTDGHFSVNSHASPLPMQSPWAREPHPLAREAAARFLDEVDGLGAQHRAGLYGVLIVHDGADLRELRAAPAAVSSALGLDTLRLPAELPTVSGDRVAVSELFPRGVPEALDDCPTSRLFAHAITQGLSPLASAEIWCDSAEQDGLRHHGRCYPASRGIARPLIRAMLGDARFAELDASATFGPTTAVFDTVFEDDHVIVVDKPSGLLSVPGLSAVADVQSALQMATGRNVMAAHRLDQATSGLLVLAKTAGALRFLQRMFAERRVEKVYEALLDGEPDADAGCVSLPLRMDPLNRPRQLACAEHGKASVTRWTQLDVVANRARVVFYPETGRTHQLRVHAAHRAGIGVPIVGDELYGRSAERLCLHARELVLPRLHDPRPQRLVAPVPF